MYRIFTIILFLSISISNIYASITKEQLSHYIEKPFILGVKDKNIPVWEILDQNKKLHSYIFETYDYAPIPGFSGGKMNLLVQIDLDGNFLDINVLDQDEPVFVSGLGIEPFIKFLKQYKGKSLKNSIKVRTSKGQTSSVYIDGITKATASVHIANDIILGSSVQVAKEKLFASEPKKIYHPKKDLFEKYTWKQLIDKKLLTNIKITKAQMEKLFESTQYEKKLPKNEKDEIALDLYIADVSIPSISKNLLKQSTLNDLNKELRKTDEAIIVFANGTYSFLTDKFVPRTSPDELEVQQDQFTLNIRDGDYTIEFLDSVPKFEQAIILEVDKRYDFDPSSLWTLKIKIVRGADSIFSTPVVRYLSVDIELPKKYFNIPKVKVKPKAQPKIKVENKEKQKIKVENKDKEEVKEKIKPVQKIKNQQELKETPAEIIVEKQVEQTAQNEIKQETIEKPRYVVKQEIKTPFWLSSIYEQKVKLISLTLFLNILFIILYKYQTLLSKLRYKRTILLTITLFFIGWYGQGQLSIVTVVGVLKAIYNSQTLTFLLYDPFSLIIWFFVFISLVIWGRGTFCGWLCPYGVLQEFSHYIGRLLRLPQIKISEKLNSKLVYIKYFILEAFILSIIFEPNIAKYLMEIEPFKTSITLIFNRELPYVIYALFWIFLGMFLFKGFCRYICPLGAFLSILGRFRIFDWLPRRVECGNPCDNCHKNCNYQAIDKKDGHIKYTDCFQCLDCVEIYSDKNLCKVLIKDAKKQKDIKISKWSEKDV